MNTSTERPISIADEALRLTAHPAYLIPVFALGMGLSLSIVITYVLCVLGYLLFPSLPIEHSALAIFLPGFTPLTWPDFFLGLIESFGWGWYAALVFGPLYNFFAARP